MTDFENGKQLVNLIKYYCFNGEKPIISNYKEVLKVALYNSLTNIFYLAIKDDENCPEDVKNYALRKYNANVHLLELQKYYSEQIYNKLDEKGVNYLPIKGASIRKTYKSEVLRTSCDVDFYYDDNKRALLDEALSELGFSSGILGKYHLLYKNSQVTVEAHFVLTSTLDTDGGRNFDKKFENFFEKNEAVKGCGYALNDFDAYLQFTMHNVKHLTSGGFGIRTVLDYAYLNLYNEKELDGFIERLEEFGVKDLVVAIKNLIDYWFFDKEASEETLKLEKFVLRSDTYGSSYNSASYVTVVTGKKKFVKLRYLFRKIFPSYKGLCVKYAWLKKAPILLPIAHVVRWFEAIFIRPRSIKHVAKTIKGLNVEEIDDVEKLMKSLNIK